jgi:menaquinone-dependent protoporphyrinogen oxidase
MKRALVAYATFSGSTSEVAQAVAAALTANGLEAEALPLESIDKLDGYDAVVIGAPMILGWHRGARRFLHRHRAALRRVPFAVFVMAMSLTQTSETSQDGVPILVDGKLAKAPARPGRLSLRERYATVANYARPILKAARPARPGSLAFFGGRLDYGRLKWWAVLFAMVIVRAPAGDRRDFAAIRSWAEGLAVTLRSGAEPLRAEPPASTSP